MEKKTPKGSFGKKKQFKEIAMIDETTHYTSASKKVDGGGELY